MGNSMRDAGTEGRDKVCVCEKCMGGGVVSERCMGKA